MKEILDFLKSCGTFYLATVEDGKPQVRPFGAVCTFEGKLYLVTNNQKPVYRQMKACPSVAVSGMHEGKWIRLCGEVEEDSRREARVAMLEDNPSLGGMYSADDGLMTVFCFKHGKAAVCSFTDAPVEYTL